MALPGLLQTFFLQHHQRFMQPVQGIDGRGVVVGALGAASPIVHDQVEVEKPALHLGLAVADGFHGARAEADRRQARRAGQAFLRAGVDRVDLPCVHLQRRAAQGGDGIDYDHRALGMGQARDGGRVGTGAGGSLCLHESDDLGIWIRL